MVTSHDKFLFTRILLDKLLQIDIGPSRSSEQLILPNLSNEASFTSIEALVNLTDEQLQSQERSRGDLPAEPSETADTSGIMTSFAGTDYENILAAAAQQYKSAVQPYPSAGLQVKNKRERHNLPLSIDVDILDSQGNGETVSEEREKASAVSSSQVGSSPSHTKRSVHPASRNLTAIQSPSSGFASPMSASMSPRRPGSSKRRATLKRHREEEVTLYVPAERDEDGKLTLPQVIGTFTLVNLGAIVADRSAYHTDRYIYPVGYTIERYDVDIFF